MERTLLYGRRYSAPYNPPHNQRILDEAEERTPAEPADHAVLQEEAGEEGGAPQFTVVKGYYAPVCDRKQAADASFARPLDSSTSLSQVQTVLQSVVIATNNDHQVRGAHGSAPKR